MCETMANVPVEDNSSYVLTEDMIDAAMTEQFAYQDEIESEEELSSQDDNMEIDQCTQGSSIDNTENSSTSNASQSQISSETVIMSHDRSSFNSDAMSVVVIETGLDKSQTDNTHNSSEMLANEAIMNNTPELLVDNKSPGNVNVSNSTSNCSTDESMIVNKQGQPDLSNKMIENTEENKKKENEKNLPILKKILSDKPFDKVINNNIESIDLCNSDTDEFSEDEMAEIELIDDELKSVMESNLMAEVGISINKQKSVDLSTDTAPETTSSMIVVKNIAQMSSNVNNSTPQNNNIENICNKEYISSKVKTNETRNKPSENTKTNSAHDITIREKDQVSTSIHINKIAVPHQTFVNSQGQKMKCVYVRSTTALPVVINSNQSSSISNSNIKYIMTSPVKKVPVQMSPIAALTNMTKQNLQKTMPSKPAKMLSIAKKLQKPTVLQNIPPRPHQFNQDHNLDSLIKSLLFHNLKKPYSPPEVSPSTVIYTCKECCDRFILQSSLSQHLARRSINIRYWCRICKAELQFFNRCVLFKHLRGHNNSLRLIDTTCITFSPVAKDMIDNGIVSTFFNEPIAINLPNEESILQKSSKEGSQNEDSIKRSKISASNDKIITTVNTLNNSIQKITTVNGQTKGICFQTPSVVNNKSICSTAPSSQSTKTVLPIVLPTKPKLSVVQNLQKQNIEQSSVIPKTTPKSVILLCNKLPIPSNVKKSTIVNNIQPNVVYDSELKKADKNVDNIVEKANDGIQEERIDIENVIGENNDISSVLCIETEKTLTSKEREKKLSSGSPKQVKRYCTECGVACLNISKHLNGSNRPIYSELICEICKLIMPTRCALKIHLRIHNKIGPFKCPDCGKDFTSWQEVHAHLKFSCGHLAKCVRYMCVSCKAHFPSVTALGHHISSKHARDIYKCNECPVAFFNKNSLKKHISVNHPNELHYSVMDYKQCTLCPKKLVPKDKFVSHVQEHTNNKGVLIYGYKCPMCSIVFANKMAFIIHQIKEKGEVDGEDGKNSKKKPLSHSKKSSDTKQSNEANSDCIEVDGNASDSNPEFDEEPQIVRKFPEPNNSSSMLEKDPLSLEDWEYTQEQRVKEKREELCIVCKKNYVVILPGIDLNDQSLCCKQCVSPLDFLDSEVNRNIQKDDAQDIYMNNLSIINENSMKRKRSSLKTVQRSSSCDEIKITSKKRRTSDISQKDSPLETEMYIDLNSDVISTKKKCRKKPNRDKIDPVGQAHIQGQVITSKSPDELVCSKCNFIAETRDIFIQHLSVHRLDPNTYQCLECGLCFVVLPSLERHLQMHHGIKDVTSYTEKNKSSLPQKFLSMEDQAEDNQCKVCYKMFDSDSSLGNHFRTHGMAFMSTLSKSP